MNLYYKAIALGSFLLLSAQSYAQGTDNPYRTKYAPQFAHWTDSLNWGNVVDVTTLGAIADDNQSDQIAIEAGIAQLAAQPGGGVLYFPPGNYDLTDDLKVKSGVVLRGATPTITDAKVAGFLPLSKLSFPRYQLGDTTFGGNPTNTAFKEIKNENGATSNVGFVWLDINRAAISMHPRFDSLGQVVHAGGTTNNFQPIDFNRNCLVFGVRNNNVAIPQADIPLGAMRPYQRFSWRFSSNIDLMFAQNAVVANCRINDDVTDEFDVPNYRDRNGRSLTINNGTYRFSYTDHYGITLNRAKLRELNGVKRIEPYIWYPTPQEEPALYRKGMEVRDNWVYKTMRVGIIAAGTGLVVDGNIVRDLPAGQPKNWQLAANGQTILTNYSATLENRGIDFSGWDVTLTNNDVEVRTHSFPPSQYTSVDGEGIMNQGNSGGSLIDGVIARNNIVNSNVDRGTNPGIGLYRTRDINNVLIENNNFTGANGWIYVVANQSGNVPFKLSNVLIQNNTNAKNIEVLGSQGGVRSFVKDNTSTRNGSEIEASCHVELSNNTGYATITGCTGTRGPVATYPQGVIKLPSQDTTILQNLLPVSLDFVGEATFTGNADSVQFFQDNTLLATELFPATAKVTFTANTIGLPLGTYSYRMRFYAGGQYSSTSYTRLNVVAPVSVQSQLSMKRIQVYPNPTKDLVHISDTELIRQGKVINALGQTVLSVAGVNEFSTQTLPAGVYTLRGTLGTQLFTTTFIKE